MLKYNKSEMIPHEEWREWCGAVYVGKVDKDDECGAWLAINKNGDQFIGYYLRVDTKPNNIKYIAPEFLSDNPHLLPLICEKNKVWPNKNMVRLIDKGGYYITEEV